MKKLKIRGKDLRKLGYPDNKVINLAMQAVRKHYKYTPEKEVLALLKKLLDNPSDFVEDSVLRPAAKALLPAPAKDYQVFELKPNTQVIAEYGKKHIEAGARHQMHLAMKSQVGCRFDALALRGFGRGAFAVRL